MGGERLEKTIIGVGWVFAPRRLLSTSWLTNSAEEPSSRGSCRRLLPLVIVSFLFSPDRGGTASPDAFIFEDQMGPRIPGKDRASQIDFIHGRPPSAEVLVTNGRFVSAASRGSRSVKGKMSGKRRPGKRERENGEDRESSDRWKERQRRKRRRKGESGEKEGGREKSVAISRCTGNARGNEARPARTSGTPRVRLFLFLFHCARLPRFLEEPGKG